MLPTEGRPGDRKYQAPAPAAPRAIRRVSATPSSPKNARMSNFMQKRERYLARPEAIMHIGRGFWANLLKGGDAKPPVYGTARGAKPLLQGFARGAGSYDSGAARRRNACGVRGLHPFAFDPDQGATCRAPSPTAVLRIVGFCALTDRFSPAGEARHIAFLSAVIYG